LNVDTELGEEGESGVEERDDAASGFVWKDGGESEAGVVVDGNVEIFPAGAAGVVELTVAGDTMARADNASELLDVEMEEVAWSGAFVTGDGRRRFESGEAMEAVAAKNAANGGFGELSLGGDLKARELVTAESEDASDAERMSGRRGRRRF
jgi:hypothetical protein